jgi:hypothetical protein
MTCQAISGSWFCSKPVEAASQVALEQTGGLAAALALGDATGV